MDQLMSGYGLNQQQQNNGGPPPGYQSNSLVLHEASSQQSKPVTSINSNFKKQLTLSEKQELASRLEKDLEKNQSTTVPTSMSTSSMKSASNNTNKPGKSNVDLLTDSFMDRNLVDLDIQSKFKSQQQSFNIQPIPFTGMNAQPAMRPNQFNQPRMGGAPNSAATINNQQMGFFGNLALPAPTTTPTMSVNSFGTKSPTQVMTPSLIPPPPNKQQSPQSLINMSPMDVKKPTALDDLHDIFG